MLVDEANLKTVWIDKVGLKAAGINEESLKARLAAREQHRRNQHALRQSNSLLRRERAAKERKLAEQFLLPSLIQAGYNVREIETLRKHEREQARRAFQQQEAALASDPPFNVNALRTQRATLRQARNAALPNFNFNFVVLDTPAIVYPTGDVTFVDSFHVSPGNSFVKCSGEWQYRDSGSVHFLFLWTNETSRPATLNVESLMTVRGSAVAYAGGGEFFGNDVAFIPYVQLYPYYLNNTPPPPSQQLDYYALPVLDAETAWLFSLGDYETMGYNGIYDLSYRGLPVPAETTVALSVNFGFGAWIEDEPNGSVKIDFSSGDSMVMCPEVVLAILP